MSDGFHGQEMPGRVNHEAAPLELRSVNHLDGQASHLPLSILVLGKELSKGFEASHEAWIVICCERPGMGSND